METINSRYNVFRGDGGDWGGREAAVVVVVEVLAKLCGLDVVLQNASPKSDINLGVTVTRLQAHRHSPRLTATVEGPGF